MKNNILQSIKHEEGILGSLILLDELRPILIPKLTVKSFTSPNLSAVFEGIKTLYHDDREIDLINLEQWLKENKGWNDEQTKTIAEIKTIYSGQEQVADELNDKMARRELLEGLKSIIHDLQNKAEPASYFLSKIERLINDEISNIRIPGMNYSELQNVEAQKHKGAKLYMDDSFMQNTFFAETGFHRGEILVPFADTGAGKTYFAVWLVSKLLESGHKGVFIIRESRAKKLFERFEKAVDELNVLDNLIVADIEQGISNLADAVSTIKYHNAVMDIDFFVVDHLKILPVDGLVEWQESERITTCINRCIYLSQETNSLGIPISQVNRSTLSNSRGWEKDPQLNNLFGSSAIEQAAHMAVSIFRPAKYDELCIYDRRGNLQYVKGPNYSNDKQDKHEPGSVFIRQKKVREGKLNRSYIKYLHKDTGLVRAVNINEEVVKTSSESIPF